MARVPKNVRVLSNAFMLLYAVIFSSLIAVMVKASPGQATVSLAFFSLLLVGFFAANRLLEWGRKLVVTLMAFLCFYFGYLFLKDPNIAHPSYIIVNIIVILFYSQKKVQFRFQPDWSAVRRSILVIDDDEGMQKTVQRILLKKGYSVLTSTTGERGLQIARVQKPDLILLDVILPGIKGREVCSQLKEDEETKDIPVVFLTAKDSEDDVNAEMEVGAASHLTKPVDPKQLVSEIKKLLK